jgi:hypothetical protein
MSPNARQQASSCKAVVRLEVTDDMRKNGGTIGGAKILKDGETIRPGEYKFIKLVDVGGPPGSKYNVPVIAGYKSISKIGM